MSALTVRLPWPERELSPNYHGHWKAKWRAQQAAHYDGYNAALESWNGREKPDFGGRPLRLTATFYPPDQRKRDHDNAFASLKHYYDGMARALGVNDNCFRPAYAWGRWNEWVSGGQVVVEIEVEAE